MTPAIGLIIILNVLAFAGLVLMEGDVSISVKTIVTFGGLVPLEWLDGEYWRFLAAGFLHFGPMHIVTNGICLIAWGIPLERMFGTIRLLILYLGSIVAGACGSIFLHADPFVSAGASGGTSGLLGGLLALQLLGRIGLPISFFMVNIGLNIAVALFAPGIDWQAHLGGFAGGIILGWLLWPQVTHRD